MRRIGAFIVLGGLALMLKSADTASRQITVAKGEVRDSDVNSFGGSVAIAGKLNGSVFMIGGKLLITGEVSEDVICIGTHVEMGDSALIVKDLWVISDQLQRSEKSTVGGRIVQVKNLGDLRKMASTVLPFIPEESDLSIFKTIKITFWFILSLIILGIFPEKVARSSENLGRPLLKIGLKGLVFYALFFFLLIAFAALSLFLIGIPLLLVLFIAYFVAVAFGRTVVFYFLGNAFSRSLKLKKPNPTFYILLGILPYALLKFTPFVGMPLVIIMDFFALGISASVFLKRRSPA